MSSRSPAVAPDELTGRFGAYDIERKLGQGGMGAVYLARQVDLGRRAVVKVIAPALRVRRHAGTPQSREVEQYLEHLGRR